MNQSDDLPPPGIPKPRRGPGWRGSITAAEYHALQKRPKGFRLWSMAKPTTCRGGHRHPSKAEAATCDRLTFECRATEATLHRQFRLPLTILGLRPNGRVTYMTVDFAIQKKDEVFPSRFIDTKGRISRGWRERAMAFRQTYGVEIEEVHG